MVPVKGKALVLAAVAALAIGILAAFVAYNYFYVSICFPDNFIFVGKTLNTSELYHTDRFSWYTYDQIDYWVNHTDPPILRITTVYGSGSYNGTPCLRKTDTYRYINRTVDWPIQINYWYFDMDGKWIADEFQAFENGTFRNNGTFGDHNYTYNKYVFALPYGYQIAPRGRETISVGNRTYVCDKYYLPNQNINGRGEMPKTYWFNASIPVPVKVQPAQGDVVFELVDWG